MDSSAHKLCGRGEGGRRYGEGRRGGSVEAPPPDIASGGYELRAAFEL